MMKRIETVEIELLNGETKEFEVYVDSMAMMFFEQEYEKYTGKESSFIVELEKLQKQQKMTTIICLLGSAVHLPGKMQPVGVKYLNENVDVLTHADKLMTALGEVMAAGKVKNNEGK